jgi:hypothetical protein
MSLLFRNPEAVAMLNAHMIEMWTETVKALEEDYTKNRKPGSPATLKEYYELNLPGGPHIDAARFLVDVIDNDKIGPTIFKMKWARVDLDRSSVQLVTSDRPIDMPLGLADPKAYIAIPVAPKILFVAAHDQAVIDNFRAQNATKLAKMMNTQLIQQARTFVWGTADSQLTYIQRNFGRLPDRVLLTEEQEKAAIEALPKGEGSVDLLMDEHKDRAASH